MSKKGELGQFPDLRGWLGKKEGVGDAAEVGLIAQCTLWSSLISITNEALPVYFAIRSLELQLHTQINAPSGVQSINTAI